MDEDTQHPSSAIGTELIGDWAVSPISSIPERPVVPPLLPLGG